MEEIYSQGPILFNMASSTTTMISSLCLEATQAKGYSSASALLGSLLHMACHPFVKSKAVVLLEITAVDVCIDPFIG